MRRGYIRLSAAGPTRGDQERALRAAGITDFEPRGPVYVDDPPRRGRPRTIEGPLLPRREDLIRTTREGDEVVVMSLGRLGLTIEDTLRTMGRLGERGAAVFEVETGQRYVWHPEAAEIAEAAARSEQQRRREQLARMRIVAQEMGIERGPAAKLDEKKLAKVRKDWSSMAMSAAEVGEKYRIPVRTLYRLLGARGTPRFGGRKARKVT